LIHCGLRVVIAIAIHHPLALGDSVLESCSQLKANQEIYYLPTMQVTIFVALIAFATIVDSEKNGDYPSCESRGFSRDEAWQACPVNVIGEAASEIATAELLHKAGVVKASNPAKQNPESLIQLGLKYDGSAPSGHTGINDWGTVISEGKPTNSSTLFESGAWPASNAVLSNDNPKCDWSADNTTAIAAGTNLFWQVDLGSMHTVTKVEVRAFNHAGHFQDVQVKVCSDADGETCTDCGAVITAPANANINAYCLGVAGRYVRLSEANSGGVNWHFCRVAVYGWQGSGWLTSYASVCDTVMKDWTMDTCETMRNPQNNDTAVDGKTCDQVAPTCLIPPAGHDVRYKSSGLTVATYGVLAVERNGWICGCRETRVHYYWKPADATDAMDAIGLRYVATAPWITRSMIIGCKPTPEIIGIPLKWDKSCTDTPTLIPYLS